MNPLDFCFWSLLESKVYKNGSLEDIEERQNRILQSCAEIGEEKVQNMTRAVIRRANYCVEMGGGYMENFL